MLIDSRRHSASACTTQHTSTHGTITTSRLASSQCNTGTVLLHVATLLFRFRQMRTPVHVRRYVQIAQRSAADTHARAAPHADALVHDGGGGSSRGDDIASSTTSVLSSNRAAIARADDSRSTVEHVYMPCAASRECARVRVCGSACACADACSARAARRDTMLFARFARCRAHAGIISVDIFMLSP